jgi:hypothetical protein
MMELTIPDSQIYICIGLVALLFLFSRFKLGLSLAFCFTFFWGFIETRDIFFISLETSSPYVILYFVSGIVLIVVTLLSFVTSE